jgi:hypothetical protein
VRVTHPAGKNLKPYQGLKHCSQYITLPNNLGRKKPKTLSGIETLLYLSRQVCSGRSRKKPKTLSGIETLIEALAGTGKSFGRKKPKTLSGIETLLVRAKPRRVTPPEKT